MKVVLATLFVACAMFFGLTTAHAGSCVEGTLYQVDYNENGLFLGVERSSDSRKYAWTVDESVLDVGKTLAMVLTAQTNGDNVYMCWGTTSPWKWVRVRVLY